MGRLVRFDSRGNGLSNREVHDVSLERLVDDLEAVFDAAGVERAPLFGMSQGCAIACAFTARHPDRVSGLIFYPKSGSWRRLAGAGVGAFQPSGVGAAALSQGGERSWRPLRYFRKA